jgi:uncharacterized protein YabE (DUF348 family)
LRGALVVGLAVAALSYGSLQKRVVVRVDGRPVAHVQTFATSVGDALRRAGIALGPHDRVVPPSAAALGRVVDVFRAKPIVILLDGKPRRLLVTGLTVEQVLREVELRSSMADFVRPSRAARVRTGMTITYRRAVAVRVVHDGKTERVITNAASVRRVLRELGLKLGRRDLVRPALSATPRSGMTIRVRRVGVHYEQVRVPIPWRTVVVRDPHLEYGLRRISEGRSGIRIYGFRSTYVDDVRVARTLVASRVLRKPHHRTISIGGWFPYCRCGRGSQSGQATWYDARGLTAAHRSLPMGTVVRVTNLENGRSVTVIIRDRGPYGPGRIIDLSDNAFRRLAPLGTGVVRVQIRW